MTYNEECARIWNQPRVENPTYRLSKVGYNLDKYIVMEVHGGWAIGVSGVLDSKEEAEQFIRDYTK